MVYRVIGVMSGSSLDGLDIAYVELEENGGNWSYSVLQAECMNYSEDWRHKLATATEISTREYLLLHSAYGHYLGECLNKFISKHQLQYKVALISSHGHTTFHMPKQKMTAQLGDGAAIASVTQLPVVTDLRAIDVAFGGQGAPIVPIGEKLLWSDYHFFLNIGGIANISSHSDFDKRIAFDVCPANRVLNLLAGEKGKSFDEDGLMAASGSVNGELLKELNNQSYYKQPYPKSLANDFGTGIIFPLVKKWQLSTEDSLRTYTEHIALQVQQSVQKSGGKLLITGGGALNKFLVSRITELLGSSGIEVVIPDELLINYKEAVVMALIGVLRWREENNVLSSVTGAARDSIGGALWMGSEA